MAIELSALVTAVGAISALMKETVPVVQTIRSGFMARNKAAQEKLTQSLTELQRNLQHAGELARVAESYLKTHENILELRMLCSRAEAFLKENFEECRSSGSRNYAGSWNVLDTMFQTIDDTRDTPRKVIMDRAEWYDEKDKNQINGRLQDFSSAYQRAAASVELKAASKLSHELRGMTSTLQDVETLLRNTIYDTILRALQRLEQ